MTPIESAARAMAEQYGESWDDLPDVNPIQNGELDRAHFIEQARAVLTAIQTPDDAMIRSGEAWQAHCSDVDSLFSEMMGVAIHGPKC